MADLHVKIIGHNRTGNHWLCGLVAKNFFDNLENYMSYWKGTHRIPDDDWIPDSGTKYIYIHRKWEDVAKSCFELRKQWGINVNDFNTWGKTNYCDMFKRFKSEDWEYYDGTGNKSIVGKSTKYWEKIDMTPKQYFDHHVAYWKNIDASNLLIVTYENLKNDFHSTMLKIAKFLESNKTNFEDIKFRIGWKKHETKT